MCITVYCISIYFFFQIISTDSDSETCRRFDEAGETILVPSDHLTSGGLTTTS